MRGAGILADELALSFPRRDQPIIRHHFFHDAAAREASSNDCRSRFFIGHRAQDFFGRISCWHP